VQTTNVVTVQSTGDVGRNLIHNALFNIGQRGVGPFTVNGYTLDRWEIVANTDTFSVTQTPLNDSDRVAIGDEQASSMIANTFTGTSGAGAFTVLIQPIENVRRLAGKTVTVSFWAACGGTLKLGVNVNQLFGTGGSPSTTVPVPGQSVSVTGAWTRYSLVFTLPSISGKVLGTNVNHATGLYFWYSAGANSAIPSGNVGVQSGSIYLWGVQLEVGSTMSPLEKLDIADDLAKCQRFYQTGAIQFYFYSTAGQTVGVSASLPVFMRAPPTVTPVFTVSNVTGAAMSPLGSDTVNLYGTATATGTVQLQANFIASADL
jgi:hypothetical protein